MIGRAPRRPRQRKRRHPRAGAPDGAADLRTVEDRLRHYLNQVPGVMWTTDRDLRVTDTRGSGLAAIGGAARTAWGCTLAEALGAEAAAVAVPHHRRALAGEAVRFRIEVRGTPFDASVQPLRDAAGAVVGVTGVALDITEQTRLQEQLYLSQKLEAVGRLAGGVAHDFNNLLSVIQGNTDLLLMEPPSPETLLHDLGEIRRACERAAALTQQLLAFSRRQVLKPEVMELNARLREMERMLRRVMGEDVRLRVALADDAGRVRIDPGQVEQMVMNLAVNARDAMPRGGVLTVTTRALHIDDDEAARHPYVVVSGDYVELVVEDTGCGMDDTVRRHAFEPFFTTKVRGKGTGLGLSTVYGLVKQSGGYIWVDSAPGAGTRFRICLPRVQEAAPAAVPAGGAEPLTRGAGTVLVVEDEEGVRAVARKILERAGYVVLEAGTGEAALELCRTHPGSIELVLADVVMPGLSGPDLIERLVPIRPGMRLLYMTGYSDERLASYGVAGRELNLVGKPFRPGALLKKVAEALGGS